MYKHALSKTIMKFGIVTSDTGDRRIAVADGFRDVLAELSVVWTGSPHPAEAAHKRFDGDSSTMVFDAVVSREWLLATFLLREFRNLLADFNSRMNAVNQLRVRVAMACGETVLALPSIGGDAVRRATRLLDAPELAEATAVNPDVHLGLIVDDVVFHEVVKHRERDLGLGAFEAVLVRGKDFEGTGWLHRGTDRQPEDTSPTAEPQQHPNAGPVVVQRIGTAIAQEICFGIDYRKVVK